MVPEDSERLIDFLESVEANMVEGKVPRGEKSAEQLESIRDFSDSTSLQYDLKVPVEGYEVAASKLRDALG